MKATFGAGCFWHVEKIFRKTPGVKLTQVGYCGGRTKNPTYDEVCTDTTGHAESVQVEYEPEEISYDDLLKLFWNNHDPTTLNRQGPDSGIQYRSVIFFHTPEQEKMAIEMKKRLDKIAKEKFHKEIVTEIKPYSEFYRAEEYHQQYFEKLDKNPSHKS